MAIETIYNAVQTATYALLLYSMIGFEWKAAKVFWFYYYMLTCFIYYTLYGMMVVALTPGHQTAAIVGNFFTSLWNLFAGFLIPRKVSYFQFGYIIHNLKLEMRLIVISHRNFDIYFSLMLQLMPVWWRWYYWLTPNAWTINGLITSQLGDKTALLEIPGAGNMELKEYLKESFGYEYGFLPVVAAAHIGWILVFLLAFAFGIKFLNFQKR